MFVKFDVEISQDLTQTEDFEFETGASHTKDKFEFFFSLKFLSFMWEVDFQGTSSDRQMSNLVTSWWWMCPC